MTVVPLRSWVAERHFRRAVRNLPVTVSFPDGSRLGRGGPVMRIARPATFFHRLGGHGNAAFGEAYAAGDWDSPDLAAVLTPFAWRIAPPAPRRFPTELFELFLDESMTYSSAWFGPGDNLHTAQLRKIDGILDFAEVTVDSRVLEIGTGWGSLAIRAAQRGAVVTSLAISVEQQRIALDRVAAAGMADRVSVELLDHESPTGEYDAVVSVEEAVGDDLFATLGRVLAPGGRVAVQAVVTPRTEHRWSQENVLPGGLPAIEEQAARTGLTVDERRSLGPHYARTLSLWRSRFLAAWDEVAALGFDPVFERLWEFHLAYAEAAFRSRCLDVWQIGLRSAG